MKVSKKALWLSSRDYIMIVLATIIYAIGFCAFILPEKVVIGGVTGVSTLIYFLTNIPVGVSIYGLNIILLAFAYKVVGRQFVLRTIFGTTSLSLFISIFQPLFHEPVVHQQPVMNILLGGIICGVGIGMVFVHNGSTGGTDIIAAMVAKKTTVSIGRTMIYVDFGIISSSYLLFHNIDRVVYGLVILFLVSMMADFMVNSSRQAVQFTIFSPYWEKIANAINNEANRGCTVLNGMGWYSKSDVKILLVVCRKLESGTIFRIIKSIDEHAFITQANVNGVYGQGFDEIKMKIASKEQGAPRANKPGKAKA